MTDPIPIDARFALFEPLTDVVVVIDAETQIVYANPFSRRLLDEIDHDLVGRSITDFLHPDDLVRALEVMALMDGDALEVPVTPAIYRLRRHDGSWCPVELNATKLDATADVAEQLLIIGRYSGDRHLQERIVDLLTAGMPIDQIVDLIPEFGHWRHPHEHYAVAYYRHGDIRVTGDALATQLRTLDDSEESPWGLAEGSGEDILMRVDNLPISLRTLARENGLTSCWSVPVHDPLVAVPAMLIAWSRDHGPAPMVHRYSLEQMARSLTLVLQWRAQVFDLEQAARIDPLTGVTNRTGFFETLHRTVGAPTTGGPQVLGGQRRADADHEPLGVLYVDLDGFKAINDGHGHSVGDVVLTEVAARVRSAVRADDVVARLGGDEFAVLCPTFDTEHDLTRVAERIIAAISEPIHVGLDPVTVGASVGIATSAREQIVDHPDTIVDRADHALYRAKAEGRGRWCLAEDPPT